MDGNKTPNKDVIIPTLKEIGDVKLQTYLDIAGVMFLVIGCDQKVKLINKKGCEILGASKDDIIGKNWFDTFLLEAEAELVKNVFNQLIAGDVEPVKYYENKVKTKAGKVRIIAWHNTVIRNEAGNIIGTLSSGDDITVRKQAELDLIESELKFRNIAEQSIMGIGIIQDNRIKYVNNAMAKILGFTIKEMIQWDAGGLFKLIHPLDRETAIARTSRHMKGEKSDEPYYTYRFITKSGTIRWIDIITTNIQYQGRNALLSMAFDITARKVAEEKLKESEEGYRHAFNRAEFYKDLFAHDINNILQSILSSVEISSTIVGESQPIEKLEKFLGIIKTQVERGAKLVSNVQKLSAIDSTVAVLETTEILEIIKQGIKNVKEAFPETQIDIQLETPNKQLFIKANDLLIEIFDNILSNAVIHNNNSPIEIFIRVFKTKIEGLQYLRLEFSDNGIGIQDKRKALIFTRSFDEKKSVHGMGLGLSLVKQIIDSFNGELWVEDRVEGDYSQGSKFIIQIPEVE